MRHAAEFARRAIATARQNHATFLDLHGLGLTALPAELWSLDWLERLDLSGNRLSELDPAIHALAALRFIDLSDNCLKDIGVLVSLPALETIRIDGNPIAAVPGPLKRATRPPSTHAKPPADIPLGKRPAPAHYDAMTVEPRSAPLDDTLLSGARTWDTGMSAGAEPPEASPPPPAATRTPESGATASSTSRMPVADRSTQTERAPEADEVESAVFCPPKVARGNRFMVQFYLYPPESAAAIEAQARQSDPAADRRGTYALPLDVPRGTRIDLRLEMPGLTVEEPDAVLLWRGRNTVAQFAVAVPADAPEAVAIGRIRIAIAGIPAGNLHFQTELVNSAPAADTAVAREIHARRYRSAFVSYSSRDRAEVLRRIQAFKIAGITVFQDVLDLDPGDRWEKTLYRKIDDCDVFLLFWSQTAADSEWVGKEIEYALARKAGKDDNPPDIQPVPIEGPPIPRPPSCLQALHFNDALLAQIFAADAASP